MPAQTLPIAQHRPEDLVFVSQTQELVTDSFLVAKYFSKQHSHVLRKIRDLDCSHEFTKSNFGLCHKNNELQNNKLQPFYQMTKDGFMFLVMGFTGKKAAVIKEAYINAFNLMAEKLAKRTHQEPLPFMLPTKDELMDDFKDGLDTRILLDIENGQIVRSMVVPQDAFVCNKEKFISFMGNNRLFTNQEIIAINTIAAKRLSRM